MMNFFNSPESISSLYFSIFLAIFILLQVSINVCGLKLLTDLAVSTVTFCNIYYTQIAIFLSLILLVFTNSEPFLSFNGSLLSSFTVCFFHAVIAFTFLIVLTSIKDAMKRQRLVLFEFVTFLALSFIGLLILCLSYDFLGFYLALELQTLAFYVLASYRTDSDFSIEAGLKYFVSGSFASGLLLFSIALLYLSSGTLSFETLKNLVDSSVCNNLDIVILGYFFLLVSLLFKVGAVPFHMWLPDVYEGSSITVTFFFATVPKIALFFALLKIGIIIFGFTNNFIASIAHFAAICSIILAAVAALYQKKLKRLIAYSAISHSGFLLLGIAANSLLSFKVTTFYVLVYCGISICFFTMILTTANIHFTFFKYLVNWGLFANKNPILALCLAFCLFSIAGVPPFTGFYSKLLVFIALISNYCYWKATILAVFSGVSCFYYIRIVKVLFFGTIDRSFWTSSASKSMELSITHSFAFIACFLLHPWSLLLAAKILVFL